MYKLRKVSKHTKVTVQKDVEVKTVKAIYLYKAVFMGIKVYL